MERDDGAFCLLLCAGRSAAGCCGPGSTLLCMGLFSLFLSRPCRAPPKGRYAGSGTRDRLCSRLRHESIQLQHMMLRTPFDFALFFNDLLNRLRDFPY
jgi:hypothetical protein